MPLCNTPLSPCHPLLGLWQILCLQSWLFTFSRILWNWIIYYVYFNLFSFIKHFFVWTHAFISLAWLNKIGMLYSRCIFNFERRDKLFHNCSFTFPSTVLEIFSCSTSLSTLAMVRFFSSSLIMGVYQYLTSF